jgi:DNA-binding response OmpR family regulator
VIGTVEDADDAMEAVACELPDLALVDLHLARGTTGFSVAVRLHDVQVPTLFVTGKSPGFPMPDLALGCLLKPFTADEIHRALAMAEDRLRGRETLRPKTPANLTMYEASGPQVQQVSGFIPSRLSLRIRLQHWIAGYQQ